MFDDKKNEKKKFEYQYQIIGDNTISYEIIASDIWATKLTVCKRSYGIDLIKIISHDKRTGHKLEDIVKNFVSIQEIRRNHLFLENGDADNNRICIIADVKFGNIERLCCFAIYKDLRIIKTVFYLFPNEPLDKFIHNNCIKLSHEYRNVETKGCNRGS